MSFLLFLFLLLGIGGPVFGEQRERGQDGQVKSNLRNAATAQETHMTDNGAYAATMVELVAYGFMPDVDARIDLSVVSATDVGYCLMGTTLEGGSTFYYDSQGGGITETPCE